MSKTILLADDSLTIQKVIELTFAETDFDVIATSSGDELLEKLATTNPDIVVCDTIMPGRDGYEVCQKIKSEPSTLHIPVVLLTGTFEPFDRDRAVAAGCSEIVTKPFEARRLVETVERLASGDAAAAQAPASEEAAPGDPTPVFDGAVAPPIQSDATVSLSAPGADEIAESAEEAADSVEQPMEPVAPEPESIEQVQDEGIDFTSSGFDEMEAAAEVQPDENLPETPEHGLEYEIAESSDEEISTELESGEEIPVVEATQPIPIGEFAVQDQAAPDFDADDTAVDTPEPFEDADAFAQPDPLEDEIVVEVSAPPEPPETFSPAPIAEEEVFEPVFADAPPAEADTPAEAIEIDEPAVPETPAEEKDIDTAPVSPLAPLEEAPEASQGLSDADIDRIARRVVELAADRLEQITWDVIPDMAEIVVRERIRELESDFDTDVSENQTH